MTKRNRLLSDFGLFWMSFGRYAKRRILAASFRFEAGKNWIVQRLLWRRGVLSRPITHVSLASFAMGVVLVSIIFGRSGVLGTSSAAAREELVTKLEDPIDSPTSDVVAASQDMTTQRSEKLRDTIIEHTVAAGETLSQIAEKYNIDTNTIRWANNLSDADKVKPGQKLKVPPVSGVVHTVEKGDTVYSIADKYKANPQAIVDLWPNNIADDFKVQVGQLIVVPDGVPPAKPAPSNKPAPRYIADTKQGSDDRSSDEKQPTGSLGFIWPVGGIITQYFTSYHTGIDIAGPTGTPVVSVGSGKVVEAQKGATGYGWHVIVDHGNGYQTMYAHLSRIDVSVGDSVGQGKQVGLRGSTGRSTGPHLHFEVRKGGFLNPLSYLK